MTLCNSPLPRIVWTLLAGSALLLSTGCDEPQTAAGAAASRVATASFDIGAPSLYERRGVYTQFVNSHGIYLVSDHRMLVALAAECTNPEHAPTAVRWDDVAGVFRCLICDAKFTRDGLNRGNSRASVSLNRCRVRSSGRLYEQGNTIVIDPDKHYRQEDNQWSVAASFFPLADVLVNQKDTRQGRD